MRYLTLGALAGPLPNNIIDGMVADAAPVMANIQSVVDNVNNNIGNYSLQTPSSGFAITMANNTPVLVLKPAGTLAVGAVLLPAVPVDGMIARVTSTQTITTLIVGPSPGQAITNAPTTILAGTGFSYLYRLLDNTWYRLS